jgi:hypothetical protein
MQGGAFGDLFALTGFAAASSGTPPPRCWRAALEFLKYLYGRDHLDHVIATFGIILSSITG